MRHTTTMKQVMTSPHFQFSALTVLLLCLSAGNVFSAEPAIPGYTPTMRLNAKDAGVILRMVTDLTNAISMAHVSQR